MEFSHLDEGGNARMVDVSAKDTVRRKAIAKGMIHLSEATLNSIRDAEQAHPVNAGTIDMRGVEYPQVRFWLKQNMLKEVETWLDDHGTNLDAVSHFKTKLTFTMQARALLALAREDHPGGRYLDTALELLAELLELAEDKGWVDKAIEILALQALASEAYGDTSRAGKILERALSLAEPEGYIRTFVDEGSPMARLLHAALARGIAPDYVRRLLAAFPVTETGQPIPSTSPESGLIEHLSERELEVLALIAEGLTNQEVGAGLFLSLNTVKAHTRNIYGKLGVHSRTQAIARAHEIGLLTRR